MKKSSKSEVTIPSHIGELSFTHGFIEGYPTTDTVTKLFNEIDFQRACQAYLWGMPIVAMAEWQHSHKEHFKAASCNIVHYEGYVSKLGILTANATTPYAVSFIDLAETGPIVVVIPEAEVRGAMHDMWQIAITPLKDPGKYVFHAPGTPAPTVTGVRGVFETTTNNIMLAIRLMAEDSGQQQTDLDAVGIYPLSQDGNDPVTTVIPASDDPWRGWQPRGLEYFERLADILGRERVDERDRFIHAMLRPLGIVHGQPFAPDDRQERILKSAAEVGEAMAKANVFSKRVEGTEYAPGTTWEVVTVCPPDQRHEDYEDLDGRAAYFYEAVTNDPNVQSETPNQGQRYLSAYKDADGEWLDGGQSYVLRVPADQPMLEFWSVTVYDVSTRCLIRNKTLVGDKSSRTEGLIHNGDAVGDGTPSYDIYFGPTRHPDHPENWIQTNPGAGWFAYFRLYSPTDAYFNQTWILPSLEKASW